MFTKMSHKSIINLLLGWGSGKEQKVEYIQKALYSLIPEPNARQEIWSLPNSRSQWQASELGRRVQEEYCLANKVYSYCDLRRTFFFCHLVSCWVTTPVLSNSVMSLSSYLRTSFRMCVVCWPSKGGGLASDILNLLYLTAGPAKRAKAENLLRINTRILIIQAAWGVSNELQVTPLFWKEMYFHMWFFLTALHLTAQGSSDQLTTISIYITAMCQACLEAANPVTGTLRGMPLN